MKIRELLTEAQDLEGKYEILYKHLPDRSADGVKNALKDLATASEREVIYNVEKMVKEFGVNNESSTRAS